MDNNQIDLSLLEQVAPSAKELTEEEINSTVGACGCGWFCTFTADCKCSSGFTVCWGPAACKPNT